jgi:ribosome-binding factor A
MPDRRQSFPSRGGARFARSLRVNQVLREVLAVELERLADADERLRLLTITSVETAPDLRNATVFLSTLGDEAAEALEERRSQLQGLVGRQMRIKRTPRLSFVADPAVASGAAVEEALRRIRTPREGDAGPS